MISLEGLTLATGPPRRGARHPAHVRAPRPRRPDPEPVPRGRDRGPLPHRRRDAVVLPRARSLRTRHGRRETRALLLPKLVEIVAASTSRARASASASIRRDGLLRQGAAGYQLTWMDAKVGDWVVTPRRGKAVEINALFYNALCLLERWLREAERPADAAGADDIARDAIARAPTRCARRSTARFWNADGGYLYDVVDARGRGAATTPACAPTSCWPSRCRTRCSTRRAGSRCCDVVRDQLVTPFGLRSLAPGHPDYKPRYDGDLRARDAAYHQGTVWGWLIGPFVDAWLKTFPDDSAGARALARRPRARSCAEACVGTHQRDLRRRAALHAARLRRAGLERRRGAARAAASPPTPPIDHAAARSDRLSPAHHRTRLPSPRAGGRGKG